MPLRVDDILAWIEVDGRELPSYYTKMYEKRSRIECFIPSEEGKAFSICWQNLHRSTDTGTRLIVDGVKVKGTRLHAAYRKPGSGERIDMQRQSGVQTSVRTERAFVFASPKEGDLNRDTTSDSIYSTENEAGTITMVVSVLSNSPSTKSHTTELAKPPPSLSSGRQNRNEHVVQLGETRDITPSTYRQQCRRLQDIATFVFRYRPIEVLNSMHYHLNPPRSVPRQPPVNPPPYEVEPRRSMDSARRTVRFSMDSGTSDDSHGSRWTHEPHANWGDEGGPKRPIVLVKHMRRPMLPRIESQS